jgi:hypothetical protein
MGKEFLGTFGNDFHKKIHYYRTKFMAVLACCIEAPLPRGGQSGEKLVNRSVDVLGDNMSEMNLDLIL